MEDVSLSASADVAVARRKRVAQQIVLTASLAILLGGVILLMLAGSLSGFVRPIWIYVVGIASFPVFLVVLVAGMVVTSRMPSGAAAVVTHDWYGQLPRAVPTILSVLPMLVGFVLIAFSLQSAVPALALGSHPARALADHMAAGPPCSKCAQPVYVQFETANRVTVIAELAGADGLDSGDGPGTPLVYDPTKPSRVMREIDWAQGRGATSAEEGAAGLGVLAALILSIVLNVRHRRRVFGHLKPDTAITRVCAKATRGGVAWRVDFADRTHTTYTDSARIRPALLNRLTHGAAVEISDEDRTSLGMPFKGRDLLSGRGA